MPEADFTFCRLAYRSVRFEQSGIGWQTDYPYAEINLMTRLSELTKTHIGRDDTQTPRHYVVRFEPFADRITLSPVNRAADLRPWVARYAKRLEAQCREYPLNWFNFYRFWDLKRMVGRRPFGVLLLFALAASPPTRAGQLSPLDELMQRLAAVPERHATFEEDKTIAALTQPLRSNGRLVYRRPSYLEKITYPPHFEAIVVEGGRLVITMGDEPPRSIDLDSYPEIGVLVDAVRGTLAGDLASLRRNYTVRMDGTLADWRLFLAPTDPKAQRFLREVTIAGAGDEARTVQFVQANGDRSVMTVHPAS